MTLRTVTHLVCKIIDSSSSSVTVHTYYPGPMAFPCCYSSNLVVTVQTWLLLFKPGCYSSNLVAAMKFLFIQVILKKL